MNKNAKEIYDRVLAVVLDDFGLTKERMFSTNEPDSVNARASLIISLRDEGLSDKEIAECTQKNETLQRVYNTQQVQRQNGALGGQDVY